jgi:hypothetical protein
VSGKKFRLDIFGIQEKRDLVTTAWGVLRLLLEERAPDMEDSCEDIEQAIADSEKGLVLQLGVWATC